MRASPKPPKVYEEFVRRYPKLGQAWEAIAEGGKDGPIDEKTARLVKLGVAIGALREGAIHSSVRKALAQGIAREELEQVVALAAGTIGLPSTVAVFSWIQDHLPTAKKRTR
jgi:alkylhydroperoxidase/carboxymuconolactone decarboxylase family protein YurZ